MRLRNVVLGIVIGAGALALVGLTSATMAGAVTGVAGVAGVASTNPAITIRAIDRAGKQVAVQATMINLSSGASYSLTSTNPARVPRGSYDIGAFVPEPGTGGQTLVNRELAVSGSQTVTFDARKGRPVRLTVNDSAVAQSQIYADVYSDVGNFGSPTAVGNPLYAVPGALPSGWHVFLLANLTEANPATANEQYGLIHIISGSIPANPTFASDRSRLANVHLTERRVDPGDEVLFELAPMSGTTNFVGPAVVQSPVYRADGPTPFSITFHLTPGYGWAEWESLGDEVMNNPPVWWTGNYSQTFEGAVLSPSPGVEGATTVQGNVLVAGGQGTFADPQHSADSPGLLAATDQAWLYQGSRQVAYSPSGTVSATIPDAVRWYRLRIVATRPAGATLSKSVTVNYTFPAGAQPGTGTYAPDVVVPQLVPSGLNWLNAARHGTRTPVSITFVGPSSVHGVAVWASANGGKNWYPLRVTGSGVRWSVTVTNPAKAGYVSLRVRGSDASGVTTDETIINAYAVS
jgi:hypothetical protein